MAFNWLQVLDTAECSQVDQRVCQQLHPIVSLLDAFKTEQQALKLIFPGKGPLDAHPQQSCSSIKDQVDCPPKKRWREPTDGNRHQR